MLGAVIVAAGSSRRAGFDKLEALLDGVPVLRRSVESFLAGGCACVVVVCPQERWIHTGLAALAEKSRVPLLRVDGGAERQDSVAAGLAVLPAEVTWVAVHDGARPLITPEGVSLCFAAAEETGAAACAHPVVDTLKRADASGRSLPERVSREHLWGMETPQIFRLDLLRRAYACVAQQGLSVTDEVSAMETIGVPTKLVQVGANMKITLPGDLELAELIYRNR